MKQTAWMILILGYGLQLQAQAKISEKLQAAWNLFSKDEQLKYASAGICIMDANTGKVIFEKNSNTGLVPASTQKTLTAIAAFEALGKDYTYKTKFGYIGQVSNNKLFGDLIVEGSGDPTLGSGRYAVNKNTQDKISAFTKTLPFDSMTGIIADVSKPFDINPIPDGWIWGDMGNYYGAGHWALNWEENENVLIFKTGKKEGDATELYIDTYEDDATPLVNLVTSSATKKNDNTIVYAPPYSEKQFVQGTLPTNNDSFRVGGSKPNGALSFLNMFSSLFSMDNGDKRKDLFITRGDGSYRRSTWDNVWSPTFFHLAVQPDVKKRLKEKPTYLYTITSPSLDSINYWLMKKSINLYAEGLLRTIGLEKKGFGSYAKGLEWVDSFYTANGFDPEAMHLYDGSGLSPANRVTPFAMTKALYFAKSKPWFPSFLDALPLYNGMKLKSGTINRVKCYAGYHTSKAGESYIVTFMVNNYNGTASSLTGKMFSLLDNLK